MKFRVLGALNERLHPSPSHVEGLEKVSGLSIQMYTWADIFSVDAA